MSLFDTYLHLTNPYRVNPISGSINNRNFFNSLGITPGIDVVIGPTVRAHGADIPQIHPTALIPFDSLVIQGAANIGPRAMLRRQTLTDGATLGEGSLIMDYVTIGKGAVLERGVGIAHGSEIGPGAVMEEFSFANIVVDVGAGARVRRDTALTPGVIVPPGVTTLPNVFYVGRGDDCRIPNKIAVDPKTLEIRPDQEDVFGDIFPRLLGIDLDGKHFDPGADTRTPNFLGKRYDIDPHQLTPGYTYRDAARVGYVEWPRDILNTDKFQNPTFASWLDYYIPVVQCIKNLAAYGKSDAEQQGQIAWHAAVMQSEVLALALAEEILNGKIEELSALIKGQLTLLGAINPSGEELEAIRTLYADPENIRNLLEKVKKTLPSETLELPLFPSWTIEAIGIEGTYAHQEKVPTQILNDHLLRIKDTIGIMSERLPTTLKKLSGIEVAQNSASKDSGIQKLDAARTLRKTLNPHGIDITLIPDGVRVRRFYSAVPTVASDAILVGEKENIDLGGAIVIGSSTVLVDATVRSEQLSIPVLVGKDAVLWHAGLHTARREQDLCLIGDGAVIKADNGEKSWIHGAEIYPKTLVYSATVGDEARLSGIAVRWTVFGSSVEPVWGIYAGNTAAIGTWEGGETFRDFDRRYRLRTAPALNNAQQELLDWLYNETCPLKGIDLRRLNDREVVEGYIDRYADLLRTQAKALLAERVEKYGPIYEYSAHLQIAVLNLELARDILKSDFRLATETENYIKNAREGILYLLGRRDEISQAAAIALNDLAEPRSGLTKLQELLGEVAAVNETIEIKEWPEGDGVFNFNDAKAHATKNLHPLRHDPHRRASYPNKINLRVHGEGFVIDADKQLERDLHETTLLGSKHVTEVAKDLSSIPELVQRINKVVVCGEPKITHQL